MELFSQRDVFVVVCYWQKGLNGVLSATQNYTRIPERPGISPPGMIVDGMNNAFKKVFIKYL